MATRKITNQEPVVTKVSTNLTAEHHAEHSLALTLITIMVKTPKKKASFEFEIELNGDSLGVFGDRYKAEAELRAAALQVILEMQAQRALVELEAQAGVPEAIEELRSTTPKYTINYNRITGKFDLFAIGGSELLASEESYLEADIEAQKIFNPERRGVSGLAWQHP